MKEAIIDLIGSYDPVLDSAGNVVSGMAGVDWPWIVGAVFVISGVLCALGIVASIGRRF